MSGGSSSSWMSLRRSLVSCLSSVIPLPTSPRGLELRSRDRREWQSRTASGMLDRAGIEAGEVVNFVFSMYVCMYVCTCMCLYYVMPSKTSLHFGPVEIMSGYWVPEKICKHPLNFIHTLSTGASNIEMFPECLQMYMLTSRLKSRCFKHHRFTQCLTMSPMYAYKQAKIKVLQTS